MLTMVDEKSMVEILPELDNFELSRDIPAVQAFLHELQAILNLPNEFQMNHKEMTHQSIPHLVFLHTNTIKPLAMEYGWEDKDVQVAITLMDAVLEYTINAFSQEYPEQFLAQVVVRNENNVWPIHADISQKVLSVEQFQRSLAVDDTSAQLVSDITATEISSYQIALWTTIIAIILTFFGIVMLCSADEADGMDSLLTAKFTADKEALKFD